MVGMTLPLFLPFKAKSHLAFPCLRGKDIERRLANACNYQEETIIRDAVWQTAQLARIYCGIISRVKKQPAQWWSRLESDRLSYWGIEKANVVLFITIILIILFPTISSLIVRSNGSISVVQIIVVIRFAVFFVKFSI